MHTHQQSQIHCNLQFFTSILSLSDQTTRQAQESIRMLLRVLNSALETRTFLVGERVTLADITVCCNLLMLYQQVRECGHMTC